jgi:hypothetical protein
MTFAIAIATSQAVLVGADRRNEPLQRLVVVDRLAPLRHPALGVDAA